MIVFPGTSEFQTQRDRIRVRESFKEERQRERKINK